MWDFIIPNDEQHEDLPISTRSKNTSEAMQPNKKQKNSNPAKEKIVSKKSTYKATQNNPSPLDVPYT